MKALIDRPKAGRPGVYFMTGPTLSDDITGFDQALYIGECDSLAERFASKHHKADAAEWSQIFLATTSEGTFNKAHARNAEYRLRQIAAEAKRSIVLTQASAVGVLDEGDTAFSLEFVSNVETLAQTLGMTLFRPPISKRQPIPMAVSGVVVSTTAAEPAMPQVFDFDYTNASIPAQLVLDGSEFVIRRGSRARKADMPGLSYSLRAQRERARRAGILVATTDAKFEEFASDYPTRSTSAAGSMVYGSSCAGPIAWRHVGTRLLYKDWLIQQTEAKHD